MKITLSKSIVEEDFTRTGVTVDHYIHYPGVSMVINTKGAGSKVLPLSGLSDATLAALDAFQASLSADINGEYVAGEVTARAAAKAAALAETDPGIGPISPVEETKP